MTIERINPEALASPSGFSHAVTADVRRWVFLAGQTALDRDGRLVEGGILAQFETALANLLTALAAAGGGPDQLTQLTIYIVDIDEYRSHAKEIGAVWRARVGAYYPATAAVGVHRLWDPEALVELRGTAALP